MLERRKALRSQYERNGWRRAVTTRERAEYRSEAQSALARAARFGEGARTGADFHARLDAIKGDLGRQDVTWVRLKVGSTAVFPMGMRFAQNPIYAAALAAFHRVSELERSTGIGGDALDRLGLINTLHASALYERWCLIKIIAVLMQDFEFVAQPDWVEHVVASACRAGRPDVSGFSLRFRRRQPNVSAILDVEPVLANGRRPDFRLRFFVDEATPAPSSERTPIWERSRWKKDEHADMLRLLVETKKYGQDGDWVFILQPAREAIDHSTSPLAWGRDCDYGQASPVKHARGSIQLAADPLANGASLTNLRRLIALELQDVFPEPLAEEMNLPSGPVEVCTSTASFCVSCGHVHESSDVNPAKTEAGNRKWYFKCSECGAGTMQTHCYSCGTTIHKNGLQMTYHLTVADQISNVVCQDCSSGF